MNGNPNYEEREDGIWKKDTSTIKGNANYFSKIPPPMHVGTIPLKDGHIDMKLWEKELAEKHANDHK